MSSRGRRGRGRPSKTQSLSSKSHFLKKPRAYQQASDDSSRCSTPQSGIHSSQSSQRSLRTRTRQAAQKSRSFMHHHIFDNDDEMDNGSLPDNEKDSSFSDSSGDSDDENASVWSESSLSTISSTPVNRKFYPRRPKSPEFIDPKDIPLLTLPPSSTDLFLPTEHLLNVLSVYEVLRHFWRILRLSPFRFEDFCAALVGEEMSTLLSEVHITLLRALLRAEDSNNTVFGPSDIKDSINVSMYFLDSVTWFECVRSYLDSDKAAEFQAALSAFNKSDYCLTTLADRIQILQTLTDLFLTTNPVREEIMNEGSIKYDDHCRNCHSRLGDLLCCETCSAVYHLQCVDPPMEEVPEEDWVCAVCEAHKVKGVSDCRSEAERHGILCRQDPLGFDRHMRRYYLICRRIVVEGDNEVWYYSSKLQVDELLEVLDDDKWESDLVRTLLDMRKEVEKYMAVTEELTNEHKGSKKTALELEIGSLQKHQASRAERKAKELEEKRQRELEEQEKREEEELKRLEEEERLAEEAKKALESADVKTEGCSLSAEEMLAVSSTTVTTTSSEVVVTAENMESGLVAKTEEVETTTTTTTKTTTTSIVKTENDIGIEEVGSGDAGKNFTSTMGDDIKSEKESNSPTDNESVAKTGLQSALPNVRTAVLTSDGKVMTTSGQSLLSRTTKTVMVVGKDGKKTVMRVVSQPQNSDKAEDGKAVISTNSTSEETSTSEENRLIVTRSKTGSLVPKQFSDTVSSVASSTKTSMSKSTIEDSILIINKDGELTRTIRNKVEMTKTGIIMTQISYFRLGMECSYKSYTNQFSTNPLALNKHQHNEERDRKRHLSHKFSLTPASDFKWNGTTHGTRGMIVSTLRLSIAQLESNIPTPFLHPNWPIHRQNWIKAVNMCSKPDDFALALTILEASIKPVLMNPVWNDALGHTRLQRVTALEKEEIKKREKEMRKVKPEEEEYFRTTWSRYTLGLKHQVFKQKGEEYRIAGTGGWLWLRSSRVYRLVAQDKVGLRGVAAKLRAKKSKKVEEASAEEDDNKEEKMETDETSGVVQETETDNDKYEEGKKISESAKSVVLEEDGVVDISKGLVERTSFHKVTKPYSKLDQLLEKRLRQHEIEMKQKTLFEQIVLRYRKQEAEKKRLVDERAQAQQKEKEDKEEVMEVDVKEERAKRDAGKSPYLCYSASCRCRGESSGCYSITCTAEAKEDGLDSDEDEENEENDEIDVTEDEKKEKDSEDGESKDKDDEEEDMDVDVVGDKEDGPATSNLKTIKPAASKPESKPEAKPTTSSTASLVSGPSSGIISLQSLAKGGKIQLTGQLVSEIEARLALVGNTKLKISLNKHARLRGKSKLAGRKGNLPPGHKFMTKSKKRNLFILERSAVRKLARGAGHREVQGFNYNCKMNNVGWPYPCPRPSFKTTWRYRTQCICNLAAAGVQLRILWAAIRWDDMAAKPPASGNNTVTTETEITTTELLKRRDTGPYGLRSEFLVRKIVVPIGVIQQPKEKYTPQRSGLRERKRAEEPRQTEPSLSESWLPEESLELWEIKLFGDKVEKQRAALQEKLAQQQQKQQKEQSAAKLKADLEDQLKQQRLAMQQKRLEQAKKDDGKTPETKPAQSILQQKYTTITKTPTSGIRVITTTVSGSTTPSLVKVTPVRSTGATRLVTTPVNKVTLQPKTLLSAALVSGGKVQLPSTTVQLRPKTVITTTQSSSQAATAVTTPAGLKPIAPSTTQSAQNKGTQLQIKPQISGSSSPAAAAAAVQNLRIIQGPNGQLQVQGLLPGQQLVKLPDGRLQLITSSSTSAALQQKLSTSTPQQQQPKVEAKPQVQVQTVNTTTTTATATQPQAVKVQLQQKPAEQTKAEPHVIVSGPGQEKTMMQVAKTQTVALTQIAQPQVVQTQIAQPRVVVQGGVVTQQTLAQAQQLVQQQAAQQQAVQQQQQQQQIVQQTKILPQTVQIKGQTLQLSQTGGLGQLASVGGTLFAATGVEGVVTAGQQAILTSSTPGGTVIKTTPIAPKVITSPTVLTSPVKPQAVVVSSAGAATTGSSVAALLGTPKVIISSPQASSVAAATPAVVTSTSPSGVKPVTPVLQQLQQQLQQHRLQLAGNKVLLSSANKAALATGQPTLVKLPSGQQFLIRAPITQTAAAAALASLNNSVATGTSSTTTTTSSVPATVQTAAVAISPPPQPTATATPAKRMLVSPEPGQRSLLAPGLGSPTSPPAVGVAQGKYEVTPQVVQQVVKQALMQNQDPEIQAKLTAMHKSMQKTKDPDNTPSQIPAREILPQEVVKPKTKTVVSEKKEEALRLHVCSVLMKSMLDKIERDEKREMKDANKKARKQETAEEKAQKYKSAKLYGLLYKQKDNLQREMLKKRSNLERSMQSDIRFDANQQAEVNDAMRRTKRAIKRKQYKDAWEEDKKIKKQKVINTGTTPKKRPILKPNKLYCICKSPYDETKFYVGCDLCSNWFHGSCVGINETDAQYVDTYVCNDCRSQQENSSVELYCLCKTPYDETQFYIGCDRCQDWFHGTCVGVSKSEADKMDTYVCPKCQQNGTDDATMNSKILTMQNLQDLKGLLKNLLTHKMSWPFREPVDRRKVPDYYKIIKEPMDLSLIARKLENGQYKRLGDFVKDVMKIFDNCRYYNASDSPFYQCAEVLEPHFVQNLKVLKEKM